MGEIKNHALLHIFFEGCKTRQKMEFSVRDNNMLSSMALVGLYSLRLSFSVVFYLLVWIWVSQNHAVNQFMEFS